MLYTTIFFQGHCDEAIKFYQEKLGAELKVINYLDEAPPEWQEEVGSDLPYKFVTYSEIEIFGTTFVLTDGGERSMTNQNFGFTLVFDSEEKITEVFNLLAEDGIVTEPLENQFWARLTGNVIDKFGLNWNILTKN